jgi:hypothetical protein
MCQPGPPAWTPWILRFGIPTRFGPWLMTLGPSTAEESEFKSHVFKLRESGMEPNRFSGRVLGAMGRRPKSCFEKNFDTTKPSTQTNDLYGGCFGDAASASNEATRRVCQKTGSQPHQKQIWLCLCAVRRRLWVTCCVPALNATSASAATKIKHLAAELRLCH